VPDDGAKPDTVLRTKLLTGVNSSDVALS